MVLPTVYNKGLYLINHKSYLIILTLEYYPTKHYLMEVSWDAQSIKTSGQQSKRAQKIQAQLIGHNTIAACLATSGCGFRSYFIHIQWGKT